MLIPLLSVEILENFILGRIGPFLTYFAKTRPNEYHKIVIPAQHWIEHV